MGAKLHRANERIRAPQVRVIGEEGEQLGLMVPADALRLARERNLDLVEVAPNATPPVCRIMDFNKFKYDEHRREREAKKKHHVTKLKEVKFKPRIGTHDYQVKLNMIKKFLTRGDQVKVTMVYRGRELAHTEQGRRVLDRLVENLRSISKVERTPALEGRFMTMIIGPDRDGIRRLAKQAQREGQEKSSAGATAGSRPPAVPAASGTAPAASREERVAAAPKDSGGTEHAKTENG